MENVDCSSSDEILDDCSFEFNGLDETACDHSEDVGVICMPSKYNTCNNYAIL